ncbi:MAG: hypothetical protein WAO71_08275 [Gallionella sp.]
MIDEAKTVRICRTYAIGEGEWTDVGTVANEIQIKFHLVVNAVPSKP